MPKDGREVKGEKLGQSVIAIYGPGEIQEKGRIPVIRKRALQPVISGCGGIRVQILLRRPLAKGAVNAYPEKKGGKCW